MEYAYAALLLAEAGEELNERNLRAVLEAANCAVSESRVKALVAALEGVDVDGVGPGTVGEADLEPATAMASDDTDDGGESTGESPGTPVEAAAEPDGGDPTSGDSSDESG